MESEPDAILGSRRKILKKDFPELKRTIGNEIGRSVDLFGLIMPMLAHPFEKGFDSKEWVFEVKWDGVRAILFKNDRETRIQSRNGNDITKRYPEVVAAAKLSLRACKSAILDGEIVVLNEQGVPDFHTHQHRMHVQSLKEIMALSVEYPSTYYVFDILYKEDQNLESLGYLERRNLLFNFKN
jgi:bifunctional non-homologous end joining protein LigD